MKLFNTNIICQSRINPKEYILRAKNEDLKRAITGVDLLERLIPRVEKLFDK